MAGLAPQSDAGPENIGAARVLQIIYNADPAPVESAHVRADPLHKGPRPSTPVFRNIADRVAGMPVMNQISMATVPEGQGNVWDGKSPKSVAIGLDARNLPFKKSQSLRTLPWE